MLTIEKVWSVLLKQTITHNKIDANRHKYSGLCSVHFVNGIKLGTFSELYEHHEAIARILIITFVALTIGSIA